MRQSVDRSQRTRRLGLRCLRIVLSTIVMGCVAFDGGVVDALAIDINYLQDVKPLLKSKCYACHGAIRTEAGLRLDTVEFMRRGGDSGSVIDAGRPSHSLLLQRVLARDVDERMPPEGEPLTADQAKRLTDWIENGAVAPVAEEAQPDPATHWAFQPRRAIDDDHIAPADRIDHAIQDRLAAVGLRAASPADPVTLIRRMFLDLHGLPPTPEQLDEWSERLTNGTVRPVANASTIVGLTATQPETLDDAVVADLIDELLASPRYGERWGQHWLDVVRYADTHGYEVNTPRDNAWPYRDYVIRAFNEDRPYDQFVLEQLAGDTVAADAGTGFMVAAAVLLPGQIGKDDASIRLARQDALDEIIVGTTATFLGLTVGCARCHDHKFDPISQRDYYSIQAFFAGVDYGDRAMYDADDANRVARAAELRPRADELRAEIAQLEPIAKLHRTVIIDDEDPERTESFTKKNGHGTNPAGTARGFRDDVGDKGRLGNLSRGRYTWWDNHPGQDVFAYDPGVSGRFRIWISWGVHGSGVHTRDARYILDIDGNRATAHDQTEIARADQYYPVGIVEGETAKSPLWSGLLDAGTHELGERSRLLVRGGETGTGITADVIVLQEVAGETPTATESHESLKRSALPQLRSPVSAAKTVDAFAPVDAKFVRFTTLQTIDDNRHEPCIDELEVFATGTDPINVALAENGTIATSSGNYTNRGKHQLKHINDGRYGNSYSWISDQLGGGWVQLEFQDICEFDRIVWSRDREREFDDRLPIQYRIDVSRDGVVWQPVATSADRLPPETPDNPVDALLRSVDESHLSDVAATIETLSRLESEIATLTQPRLVYGGTFREPDATFLLTRGDPEQPAERLNPRVPVAFGAVELPTDATEQERRTTLAHWIARPDNPLTARVMVNRIWQSHFGRGLVDTPSDFGLNGSKPSHPELLDELAEQFITNGWSIKHLHRLIMRSDTYRQSSAIDPEAQVVDADCRLLWRFPPRRLEAEAIRDSILLVSGNLNLRMGGRGFNFFKTRGGLSGFPPVEEFQHEQLRRMIYSHRIRMEPVPVFGAFDCPDAGQPTPVRSQSTTAIQALNLFNSAFVINQSQRFADNVRRDSGSSIERQVDQAFRRAVGRSPTTVEFKAVVPVIEEFGLETLCRALFNSNEFLFIP